MQVNADRKVDVCFVQCCILAILKVLRQVLCSVSLEEAHICSQSKNGMQMLEQDIGISHNIARHFDKA